MTIVLCIGSPNVTFASVYFGGNVRRIPIYNVETQEHKVAISFDASWGADKTLDILNLLGQYSVDATFFLVELWINEFPDLVEEIDKRGFEIGNHSSTHCNMTKLSRQQIELELTQTNEAISNITSKPVKLFRPPFGAYNNTLINTVEALGMTTIQWDVDSLDWKGISAMDINLRVMNRVENGSIILMHNNSDNIIDGLILILESLTNKGYEITSVGNLILEDNYYVDSRGMQRKK
jgi:polysaccharide deacetylase family sporulation protein PdaB